MSVGLGRASELAWEQSTAELRAAARWGAADPETIERTLGRLLPADPNSWLMEWTAAAGTIWAAPDPRDLAGSHLAAAFYYAAAIAHIGQTDGTVNEQILWRRQRDCWDAAVDALGAERLTIPFEQAGLPAYFFRGGAGCRPLVVIDHGGRVATSHAWIQGGAAAHARGYHWLTFDGPGRQAARRNLRLVLTPRWDTVLDAVLDAAASRPDVDASRIALIGADHGAFGTAQALITTRRLAAAAVLPGILDASEPLVNALPQAMRGPLLDGDRPHFDEELRLAALFAPDTSSVLRRAIRDYGHMREPLFDIYRRALDFRLRPVDLMKIAIPLAIWSQDGAGPWAGQAARLAELVGPAQHLGELAAGGDAAVEWTGAGF
jgi:hypothetical protein